MFYIVADYKERGRPCFNKFIVTGTDDQERAVDVVSGELEAQGCEVRCITVCPDAESMDAVYSGKSPAGVFISYTFS